MEMEKSQDVVEKFDGDGSGEINNGLLSQVIDTMWKWVYEEKRRITFKEVAKYFQINDNVAKQCIWSFAERYKDVGRVYYISGRAAFRILKC